MSKLETELLYNLSKPFFVWHCFVVLSFHYQWRKRDAYCKDACLIATNYNFCRTKRAMVIDPPQIEGIFVCTAEVSICDVYCWQEFERHIVCCFCLDVSHTAEGLDAMSQAQGRDMVALTSVLDVTKADQAAKDLVRVTVAREEDVYYPYNQRLWVLRALRLILPRADQRMKLLEDILFFLLNVKKSISLWTRFSN